MTMKDISALDELERAVREEPTVIEAAEDRLREQLDSDRPEERMDAGRALRAAAEHDPELVEAYEGTLVGFLAEDNGSLRLSGALGLAELSEVAPERLEYAVPQLVDALEETVAPSIEEAIVRSLTRIGTVDPEAVAAADPVVAARLPEATLPTQIAILRSFVGTVAERPDLFDATTAAYAEATGADRGIIARCAVRALATVASANPGAIPSRQRVLDRAEELRAVAEADPRPGTGREIRAAARALTWAFEGEERAGPLRP